MERRLTDATASKDLLIRCATYRQEQQRVYPYLLRSLVSPLFVRQSFEIPPNKPKDADVCIAKSKFCSYSRFSSSFVRGSNSTSRSKTSSSSIVEERLTSKNGRKSSVLPNRGCTSCSLV